MFKSLSKLFVFSLVTFSTVLAAVTSRNASDGIVPNEVIDERREGRRLGHHHGLSPTRTIEGIVLGTRGLETLASLVAAAGLGPDGKYSLANSTAKHSSHGRSIVLNLLVSHAASVPIYLAHNIFRQAP